VAEFRADGAGGCGGVLCHRYALSEGECVGFKTTIRWYEPAKAIQCRCFKRRLAANGSFKARDSVLDCGGGLAKPLPRRHRFREVKCILWPKSTVQPAKAAWRLGLPHAVQDASRSRGHWKLLGGQRNERWPAFKECDSGPQSSGRKARADHFRKLSTGSDSGVQ